MGNIDMSGIWIMAFVGVLTTLVAIGAGIGALLALPFCLWQHDFSIMLWPTAIGGAVGAAFCGYIFRGEFTFGRR